MKANERTQAPRIEFERISPVLYDIFYDRQVLIGNLISTREMKTGQTWSFQPADISRLSVPTLRAIIDKIEWLDTRVVDTEKIY